MPSDIDFNSIKNYTSNIKYDKTKLQKTNSLFLNP